MNKKLNLIFILWSILVMLLYFLMLLKRGGVWLI